MKNHSNVEGVKLSSPIAYSEETQAAIAALFDDKFSDADTFHAPGGDPSKKEGAKAIALNGGFVVVSASDGNNYSLGARLNDDHTVQCCHKWWRRGDLGKITSIHM
jgi:hypothetical protein